MEPARNRLHRSLAGLVAVVAPVVACGLLGSCLLSGYDKADGGTGGSGGAGGATAATTTTTTAGAGGGGGEGGSIDLPVCDTTDLPAPPASGEPGGPVELFFALRTIRFGDPNDRTSVPGFDLDRADGCRSDCAGEDECGLPEELPPLTIDEEIARCDFLDGIDNSGAHLLASLAENVGTDEVTLSAQAETGAWSLILRVREWNGLPDDPTVELALFSTPGFAWTPDGTGGGVPATPLWNGADAWPIDQRSLEPGSTDLTTPAFVDRNAYVSQGVIVGALGGTFYAGADQLPIELAKGVLVAPMADVGLATFRLENAVFAGRWAGEALIEALGPLEVDGIALCNFEPAYRNVVIQVCKLLDVTEDGLPGACNALSFAFELDGYPVQPGPIVQPDVEPAGCTRTFTCADVFSGG